MCYMLGVSTSGYYDALDRPPNPRDERHTRIQRGVGQVHAELDGIYGSHKIAKALAERAVGVEFGKQVPHGGPRSRFLRQITPRAAGLHNPRNVIDHVAPIPLRAAHFLGRRKHVFDRIPSFVRKSMP